MTRLARRLAMTAVVLALVAACTGARSPGASRPELAEKWYRRAQQNFQVADVEDAADSVKRALAIVPEDEEVRLLAARIALARLEFDETVRLTRGLDSSEARGMRGRALWYAGEFERAADELEEMLQDPDVVDEWAKSIAALARRGAGRKPFAMSGALLTAVEMPHVRGTMMVVPLEIDGEQALAMISTGNAEVVLDSAARKEPSFVSLRFDQRLEVKDVPALSEDLSGLSRQVGAPIKALLGVNLLRHLNATLDFGGRQFVVRTFTPPPPPRATQVPLYYLRGGGMVLGSTLGSSKGKTKASLLVNTAMSFPLALDQAGWHKAGLDAGRLEPVREIPEANLRKGVVESLRLGALDVLRVPGVFGVPILEIEKLLTVDIDGVIGSDLLALYRITLVDGGRRMWIEDAPAQGGDPPPAAPPAASPPTVPGASSETAAPRPPAPGSVGGPAPAGKPAAQDPSRIQ